MPPYTPCVKTDGHLGHEKLFVSCSALDGSILWVIIGFTLDWPNPALRIAKQICNSESVPVYLYSIICLITAHSPMQTSKKI
jgi:hypothetical protein